MNELQLQHDLVAEANASGAHAFKANNRFLVGILDLFVQVPELPAAWIEVKLVRGLPGSGFAPLALTPKQASFIMRNQAAGGRAGWLLAVQLDTRGNYALACGTDPKVRRVRISGGNEILTRARGGRWPILEITRRIACGSA